MMVAVGMEINVLINEGLEEHVAVGWLQSVAEQVLVAQGVASNVELGLFIAGGEKIRQLNKGYLGKDEPTDVIAFSMFPSREALRADFVPFVLPPDGLTHLGEVVISYPQAVIQAGGHNHSIKREITILIIHGVLHLLGYEDEKPELKKEMTARENEILSSIGEAKS
jgi:probable rRNA maturation factor